MISRHIALFLKITKTDTGKLRTLGLHEKAYFLMNGKLQTGNEIETEIKIYGKDFCVENFYSPDNGKLYMSGFVCIDETEQSFATTQGGFSKALFFGFRRQPFNQNVLSNRLT